MLKSARYSAENTWIIIFFFSILHIHEGKKWISNNVGRTMDLMFSVLHLNRYPLYIFSVRSSLSTVPSIYTIICTAFRFRWHVQNAQFSAHFNRNGFFLLFLYKLSTAFHIEHISEWRFIRLYFSPHDSTGGKSSTSKMEWKKRMYNRLCVHNINPIRRPHIKNSIYFRHLVIWNVYNAKQTNFTRSNEIHNRKIW